VIDGRWWTLLHVVGAFGFLAAHGVSIAVAMRLRRETDPARCRTLLALSRSARPWIYGSLVMLLVAGLVRADELHAWTQLWVWGSIVLLAVLLGAAVALAMPYYAAVRRAVAPEATTSMPELGALLASPRPLVILWVETAGLLVIVWLMVFRPV
jgi:hypothetical protein